MQDGGYNFSILCYSKNTISLFDSLLIRISSIIGKNFEGSFAYFAVAQPVIRIRDEGNTSPCLTTPAFGWGVQTSTIRHHCACAGKVMTKQKENTEKKEKVEREKKIEQINYN